MSKSKLDVNVEDGVLTMHGQIDFSKYAGMQPVHTEYNIAHYRRRFTQSNKIHRSRLTAEMKDGVLTFVAKEAKPRCNLLRAWSPSA